MYLIGIEGPDCSGKETLKNLLGEHFKNRELYKDYKVITHSFPSYGTPLGDEIASILHKPIEDRDLKYLNYLFAKDREVTMANFKSMPDYDKTIIVVDRYHLSNYIYSLAEYNLKNPDKYMLQKESEFLAMLQKENDILPALDMLIVMHRAPGESTEKHKSYLASKMKLDKNETNEFQDEVCSIISNIINVIPTDYKFVNTYISSTGLKFGLRSYMIGYNLNKILEDVDAVFLMELGRTRVPWYGSMLSRQRMRDEMIKKQKELKLGKDVEDKVKKTIAENGLSNMYPETEQEVEGILNSIKGETQEMVPAIRATKDENGELKLQSIDFVDATKAL